MQRLLDINAPFVERNLEKRAEICLQKCELYNKKGEAYSPFPFPTDFEDEVDALRE